MDKKKALIFGIALMLLFTGIALATSSASSEVEIYAFDQNPAGRDEGNEWITLCNPSEFNSSEWIVDYPSNQKVKLKVSDVKYSQGFNETCIGSMEINVSMIVNNPYNFPVERIAVECVGIYPGLPSGRGLIGIPCNVPTRLGPEESVVVKCYSCGIKHIVEVEVNATGWTESSLNNSKLGESGIEYNVSNENEVFDFIFDEMDKVTYHIELGDQYSDEGDWSNATQEYHNGSIEANYAVAWLQNTKVPVELKTVKEEAIAYFSAVSSYLEVAEKVAILKEKPPEYQENLTSKMGELNYLRDDVLFAKDDLIDAINDYVALKQKLTPKPALTPSPTSISSFEFLFAIIGILAAIYLIKRRG